MEYSYYPQFFVLCISDTGQISRKTEITINGKPANGISLHGFQKNIQQPVELLIG
jgi:hypothetical protein